jgi:hypothetical protein
MPEVAAVVLNLLLILFLEGLVAVVMGKNVTAQLPQAAQPILVEAVAGAQTALVVLEVVES